MGNLDNINHIVVLMMENRSFDNVLGWLYPDNDNFYGVNGSMFNLDKEGNQHFVTQGTDGTMPYPDPNEPYEFVYEQMFNEPPTMPIPMMTGVEPNMQGFVVDYQNALDAAPGSGTQAGAIMNCFTPETLPVINALAKNYAVCDQWFCSVPSETFPNRSFLHAGTSSGNVYNNWKDDWHIPQLFINDTKTIFNLLYENGVTFQIYTAGLLSNVMLCQEQMWDFALDSFSNFDDFKTAAANGTLPAYSFIEPNFMCSSLYGAETDMHPSYGVIDTGAPTDARYGDNFILDVYNALRSNPQAWESTLLIITFDEHGGCFDHYPVPPSSPKAVSPDGVTIPWIGNATNGGSGFDFSRFGVRVPAVLVSPLIEAGTICHTQFDHTSVIRTISERFLGGQYLGARDKIANCVGEVLTLETARTDNPLITPDTPPPFESCANESLSPLQEALVAAAARFFAVKTKKLLNPDDLDTKEKATAVLDKLWKEFKASGK
jgi:phospholipase C